jgi:hypothetical protein
MTITGRSAWWGSERPSSGPRSRVTTTTVTRGAATRTRSPAAGHSHLR